MKKILIALSICLVATSVYAQGHHGHHGSHRGSGSLFIPAIIGAAVLGGIVYNLGRVEPTPPPVIIYTTPPGHVVTYYYCANPRGYYPTQINCLVPWQTVEVVQ